MGCQGISGRAVRRDAPRRDGLLARRSASRVAATAPRCAPPCSSWRSPASAPTVAVSGHAEGNSQSMRVSEKLGYEPPARGSSSRAGTRSATSSSSSHAIAGPRSKRIPARDRRARDPPGRSSGSTTEQAARLAIAVGPPALLATRPESLRWPDGRAGAAGRGARAPRRLARLRRERRRAARRVRRLRARGPAGRHRARARDEGAAPPRRGDHDRGARGRARSASRRRARTTRPAAAAASRISPTRRSSPRSTRGSRTRSAGSPASPSRRSSRSSRAEELFDYRNKMEYSFAPGPDGPDARPAPRRPLGRGARDRAAASSRPSSATAIRNTIARLGARGAAPRLRPGDGARATSAT